VWWEARGRRVRRLRVSHAFHSSLMDGMLGDFRRVAESVEHRAPSIPLVLNVSGRVGVPDGAEYWVRHVREAVRFHDGIRALEAEGVTTFVELGPDGTLSGMVQDSVTGGVAGAGTGTEAEPGAKSKSKAGAESGTEPRPRSGAKSRVGAESRPGTEPEPESGPGAAVSVPALRRDRPEPETLWRALATAHMRGAAVDWHAVFAGSRVVPLPTYAFQRQRYWLEEAAAPTDVSSAGLDSAGHPLLGAAVVLSSGDEYVFTGRLSVASLPWLADHQVMDEVLLPGAACVELALRAGDEVGCDRVEELTLEAPLVVPEGGAVRLQVVVGGADEVGARSVEVFSCVEGVASGVPWVRHASGVLSAAEVAGPEGVGQWPPAGAEPVAVAGLYERLAGLGYGYGPVFRGLRAAWRLGEEVFAEVELPPGTDVAGFGLHPALLDAALHAAALDAADRAPDEAGIRLPFQWNGVTLRAKGASALRVQVSPADGEAVALSVADSTGAPVITVDSLAVRPVRPEQLAAIGGASHHRDALFGVDWVEPRPEPAPPVAGWWGVLGAGDLGLGEALTDAAVSVRTFPDLGALAAASAQAPAPDVVVASCVSPADPSGPPPPVAVAADTVRDTAHGALRLLRDWLAEERWAGTRLVLVTRGAVAARPGDGVADLAASALWGLVRTAQTEHPDRFTLLDLDDAHTSRRALPQLLMSLVAAGEPQAAVRGGVAFVPRLARLRPRQQAPSPWDTRGTVLITGATGTLGALTARHLVTEHGVRHLLLVSRRGPAAEGAAELAADLTSAGARVTVEACDVADRAALAGLLARIPAEAPLTGVVHAAGVVDDGVLQTLEPAQLDRVLRPKVDAALNLHALTEDLPLSRFVLFSSAVATMGAAGQANYAAANAFLDALAQRRRAAGLAGTSLAWGLWASESGITGTLDATDRRRMSRTGVVPLADAEGLRLLDAALSADRPLAVPIRLDLAALRARPAELLPPLFHGLVPVQAAGTAAANGSAPSLAQRLAGASEAERELQLSDFVREQVAAVLGHASSAAVDPHRTFGELGFDSLAAVEFRNRLTAATGLRLPATLIFDQPTTSALVSHLAERIVPDGTASVLPLLAELDRIEDGLAAVSRNDVARARLTVRLQELLATVDGAGGTTSDTTVAERIDSATDDEIFEFIDTELGHEKRR
ncbi:type I polyketide synthase, partial [Streptomyces hygroscopicus]|uniref:type I polyketide synthase n=2 Tax=Streptomyces hygroscopicus TaxID=1912 RepID=UPI00378784DD